VRDRRGDRYPTWNLLAPAIAATSAITGLYLSYGFNLAAGGLIVLVTTAIFLVCWCLAPRHGLIAKLRARRRPTPLPAAGEDHTPVPAAAGS
jgi:manganese/iron transport system permease protein